MGGLALGSGDGPAARSTAPAAAPAPLRRPGAEPPATATATTTAAAASGSSEDAYSAAEASMLQKVIRTGLITNKNDIEVQRADPTSPLYSVKSFEALNL